MYQGSECTFTNLFMWRKWYNIKWCLFMEHLCIQASRNDTTFILPPFGPDLAKVPFVIDKLVEYFASQSTPFVMKGVYEDIVEVLQKERPAMFKFKDDRDNYDYVYLASDLTDLKGRKFHSKKNHVNSFRHSYPGYQYQQLTADLIPTCIDFTIEWCKKRGCDSDVDLEIEKCAVLEALRHFDQLNFTGGIIFIDGQMEAMTFGELLNPEMAVIHVEKANPDIKGLYAAINQDFCRHAWNDVKYINREEDMGIEGLRKAKESYKPVLMVKKYNAVLGD